MVHLYSHPFVSGELFEASRSLGVLGPGALLGEDDVELGFGGKDNVSGFMSSVASVVDPKGGVFTCWALEWCFFRGSLKNLTFLFSRKDSVCVWIFFNFSFLHKL